jgi:hypothetical protein
MGKKFKKERRLIFELPAGIAAVQVEYINCDDAIIEDGSGLRYPENEVAR